MLSTLALALLLLIPDSPPPATWWKGNLHTHTLWSDGDDYPEMVADWYKRNGYHFLALSDHNVLSVGEKWFDLSGTRGRGAVLAQYIQRFGEDWVRTRVRNGKVEVRLRTLSEIKRLFEEPSRFLMIQSEEISAGHGGKSAAILEACPDLELWVHEPASGRLAELRENLRRLGLKTPRVLASAAA
ncbi:MAG: hypothetical protein EDM74_10820, partial [Armatimonadetes bacterium]